MRHEIEAVLFDLGGVWLQDGDFDERTAWAHQHDLTADQLFDTYLAAIGPGWEGGRTEAMIRQDLLDRLHLNPEELPELLRVLHAHETLDPTITDFVVSVRDRHKVGVITNAGPSARQHLCEKFPLEQLTDTIVVSAEEGVSKPDPRIYLTACERIGVAPMSAIFVDDKPRHVDGAAEVGMQALLFTTSSQTVAQLADALRGR